MCTDDQHKEKMALLCLIEAALRPRPPIDFMVEISDLKFWNVDYQERKHLYFRVTTNVVITLEDYGTLSNPATDTWFNLAIPPGTKLQTSGSGTTTTPIFFRATDEVIP